MLGFAGFAFVHASLNPREDFGFAVAVQARAELRGPHELPLLEKKIKSAARQASDFHHFPRAQTPIWRGADQLRGRRAM